VLLVGSVPLETAKAVMALCARELAGQLDFLSDGETGFRQEFIQGMALTTFYGHPDLETVQRPAQGWRPRGYNDLWKFRVRPGAQLRFDHLQYAADAIKSYDDFCTLRAEGLIGPDTRFMAALPLAETGAMPFGATLDDSTKLHDAFQEALIRETERIAKNISANDLVIQWDCPIETINVAGRDIGRKDQSEPLQRFLDSLAAVAMNVPASAFMGVHLCYGNLGERHVLEPTDLSVCVTMANAACALVGRQIDYFHVPVPIDRTDEAYFEPLRDLNTPGARMYLGLIHNKDGIDGTLRRVTVARKFIREFGVSTECGFGRRRPDTIPTLLQLHRKVAEALTP
jgi:hypothetical protein